MRLLGDTGFKVSRLSEFEKKCADAGISIAAAITELKKPIKGKKVSLSDGPLAAPLLREKTRVHKNRDYLMRSLGLKKLIFPLMEMQADNVLLNPKRLLRNSKLILKAFRYGDEWSKQYVEELGDSIVLTNSELNNGNGVAVHAADCGVLLIASKVNGGAIAAIHSGWRGTRLNIVSKTLSRMDANKALDSTFVFLGPLICGDCNEFGKRLYEKEFKSCKDRAKWIKPHPTNNDKIFLDNRRAILSQLKDFGVRDENIVSDPRCTLEDPRFYSYRGDGRENFSPFAIAIGFVGKKV